MTLALTIAILGAPALLRAWALVAGRMRAPRRRA
jgi:hypothetical protein